MVLDKSGNIFITGGSVRYSTLMDFLTIIFLVNLHFDAMGEHVLSLLIACVS